MRSVCKLLVPAVVVVLAGCDQRGPMVYVLDAPQNVQLTATASASKVAQGGTVTLHVEQRTNGQWKQIPRGELSAGQCWVYRPPVELEPEVAHSVQWEVVPEGAVEFHQEYQLDKSRLATMKAPGKVTLTPVSKVTCEEGRSVYGTPVEIEVE